MRENTDFPTKPHGVPARCPRIRPLLPAVWCLLLAACTGGMSSQVRREAYPLEGFEELRQKVGELKGRTVILGGQIIEVRNESMEKTTLLILERPLQFDRRPDVESQSGGRFMVRFDRYLDPEVYRKGAAVTVAGTVEGTIQEPVGKAPYEYVVLHGREIHRWETYDRYYPPWDRYYDPYHPHYYRHLLW
jgi:outer membrane lipoprotein